MKEYFKPTEEQKKELARLYIDLKKYRFNIFSFLHRIRKEKGYFPPLKTLLKIGQSALKSRPKSMWAYFTTALKKELPKDFADLNIGEAKRLKNEPMIMEEIFKQLAKQKAV